MEAGLAWCPFSAPREARNGRGSPGILWYGGFTGGSAFGKLGPWTAFAGSIVRPPSLA